MYSRGHQSPPSRFPLDLYCVLAVYHAKRDVLVKLDRVQTRFIRDAGLTEIDALMKFNLAPLAARRDIAMLGLIHRTVLGKGPRHFKEHFKMLSSGNLHDPRTAIGGELVKRSALGLAAIYNMLPSRCRKQTSVKFFQTELQRILKERATESCEDWVQTFSPRLPTTKHPLLSI